jgi:diacylglycerol kinase (ATP)
MLRRSPRENKPPSWSNANLSWPTPAAIVANMNPDPSKSRRRAVSRIASFRHAFAGWWYVLRTQHNAWIHAVASVAILVVALGLGLERLEWAILILIVTVVWVAEFVNTAVETLVDLLSPEIHPLAKIAKDIAAASVLIAALAAIVIGLLLLGPKLWMRLSG